MNEEKKKPCADCGSGSVVESAKLKGIRATDAHDKVSVLAAALSASGERSRTCEEAYLELEKEFDSLEASYNTLQEAFEGHYSDVGSRLPKGDDYDNEEGPE